VAKSKKAVKKTAVERTVKSVKIHEIIEGWDDGDPLYEVNATLTFSDGKKERHCWTDVRAGHLHSLKHPRSKYAKEDFKDLLTRD
jgi:hypothetical protein